MSIRHYKKNYNINQRGADKIFDVTMTKYQRYLSKIMLKNADDLAQIIKSLNVHYAVQEMYSIEIYVRTMTILVIIHEREVSNTNI